MCIDGQHSLFSFFREIRLQFRPHGLCALRGAARKVLVAGVRRDVADDEIANIDGSEPITRPKTSPAISGISFLPESGACLHGTSPIGLEWLLRRLRSSASQLGARPDHRSDGNETLDLYQATERDRRKDGLPTTTERVHFSEILTSLRFVANSNPALGPCKAIFTPFSLPS